MPEDGARPHADGGPGATPFAEPLPPLPDGAGRLLAAIAISVAVASIALVVLVALFLPLLNWDLLAYVGAVKSWSLATPGAIQRAAYADVHRFAQTRGMEAAWQSLTSAAIPYRHAVASNPVAFIRQLPFYRIRPLYLLLLWLLSHLTATVSAAAVDVSAAAVLLSALVLAGFARQHAGWVAAAVWPAMFCLTPIVVTVARLQTPDALATLAIVTASVLFLSRREAAAAAVLLLTVLIRTDLMILAMMLACTTWAFDRWSGRRHRIGVTCVLLSSAALEIAVSRWSGNYGYLTLLKFTFVDRAADPAVDAAAHLSLTGFLGFLWKGILLAVAARKFPLVIVAALGLPFLFQQGTTRESIVLYAALVLYLIAHCLLFPSLDGRFAAPVYGGLFAILIAEVRRRAALRSQNRWNPMIVPISSPIEPATSSASSTA